ncbi:metallophosphoesterase [Marinoscillum furvescens]|uniref:Calcineurin-like phosphoesterase family protein n=1 Tax=Marinoscillum furvescens DSM 4134 TaxID=1122208 RepID=A0A3D9KYS5_MARFU|nr:metallophosphoesterase [Marinoscillum furvescens]RED94953.1 calcineurin-like phosphoesterase family protein [Marinoscillum furvescens DSM 4134]
MRRIIYVIALYWLVAACGEPKRDFTFVQLCDTQLGFGGYSQDSLSFRQAVNVINNLAPDFVVICGDLVDDRDAKSFEDFLLIAEGFEMPYFPAPGNHDVGNTPSDSTLEVYRRTIGPDYYYEDHKGCRVIVTNTQLWKAPLAGASEKHQEWFEATLAGHSGQGPVFVVGHYPLFLENPEEEEAYFNLPLPIRAELMGLFEKHQVSAYLAGHTHRRVINHHNGVNYVGGETISKNFDQTPLGFRMWEVSEQSVTHQFLPLDSLINSYQLEK